MSSESREQERDSEVDVPYRPFIQETLDVIREEYDNGTRDLHGGGVPTQAIADRTQFVQGSIPSHVQPLVENGTLERVWGIGYDTGSPRRSYIPVDAEQDTDTDQVESR